MVRYPLFGLSACAALVVTGLGQGLGKSDWAAWVQAVGSIFALGVAIAVSAYQNSEQKKHVDQANAHQEQRDAKANANALKGLLLGIRAELMTSLEAVEANIGVDLEASRPGEAFRYSFLVSENSFPVYLAMLPSFHLIPDHSLRVRIVRTYGVAKSLILTFQTNNNLLDAFDTAYDIAMKSGLDADRHVADAKDRSLIAYGGQLRTRYSVTKSEVLALLAILPSE